MPGQTSEDMRGGGMKAIKKNMTSPFSVWKTHVQQYLVSQTILSEELFENRNKILL